jgi:hypothetical protein
LGYTWEEMNLSEDEKKNETFTFEHGKIDQILSDLADLILIFKELRDKKLIEEVILERIVTIYEHLHTAVVNSRIDNNKIGKL